MSWKLVFDVGSRVIKCAIGDEQNNIVALEEKRPTVTCSEDGFCRACDESSYWDDIIGLTKKTIVTANIDPQKIKFITSSSIRPSCVFTDEDLKPLYIGSSFDLRGMDSADVLEEQFSHVTGKTTFDATGHFPSFMFSPSRYAWYKENKREICGKITRYLPVDSWILCMFGGEEHANISSAAESGFFDIKERLWNREWIDILDLNDDFFPAVIFAGEVVGNISPEIQKELGLSPDVAIVSGLPDTQAALIGSGCVEERDVCAVIGTTGPVQALHRKFIIDKDMKTWTSIIGLKDVVDSYILEANTGLTGRLLDWVSKLFFNRIDYPHLDEIFLKFDELELADPESVKNVIGFLGPDYLASSGNSVTPGAFMFPTPGMLDEESARRASFITATFENIQFAIYKNIQYLKAKLGQPGLKKQYVLGGITRNELFCQRFADLTRKPVITTPQKESTIIGLFITCSIAEGTIKNQIDLKSWLDSSKNSKEFKPRSSFPDLQGSIKKRYKKWDALREKIKSL